MQVIIVLHGIHVQRVSLTRDTQLRTYKIMHETLIKHNEDGLCTMVTNERQARELHMVRKRRE